MIEKKVDEARRATGGAYVVASVAAVLGVVGSIAFCQARRMWETRSLEAAFAAEAENLAFAVEREMRLFADVLTSLGRVHSISVEIEQDVFREFVRKGLLFHRQILGTFGWAPSVSGPERELYEDAMRRAGNAGFEIAEHAVGGQLVRAGERDSYYPVSYVEPTGTRELPIGLDLASDDGNRRALLNAARTRETTVSESVWTPPGGGDVYGRFAFSPIFQALPVPPGEDRLGGFVVALLQPREILEKALSYVTPGGVDVFILDRTGPQGERLVYAHSESGVASAPTGDREGGLRYEKSLRVAGLTWAIVSRPSPQFIAAHHGWMPWAILAGGLLFTALLTVHLVHIASHTEKVERTVRERTAELTHANAELTRSMIERRRLEQEVLEVSTLEKRRVGQDLHDSLGQQMTGIGLLSCALEKELTENARPEVARATRISALMKEAITQVRRIARGLSPVEMDAEGLADALERLAEDTADLFEIACTFSAANRIQIHDNIVAINLYHVAQEAVNNAARHGKPSRIEIALANDDAGGTLSIADDGTGISTEDDPNSGMGLKIMRYRAEMIGGTLDVTTSPGGGTRITCRFLNRRPPRQEAG